MAHHVPHHHVLGALLLALSSLSLPAACDTGPRAPAAARDAEAPAPTANQELSQAPADDAPAAEAPADAAPAVPAAWRAWVDAETSAIQRDDPEFYNAIRALTPTATRAGNLRIVDERLHDVRALPLLLDRLIHESHPPEVRAALVDALPRTGGAFGAPVVDLLADERDDGVKLAILGTLRRTTPALGVRGVGAALSDKSATVRASAARVAAYVDDPEGVAPLLLTALADGDTAVKAAAARSLGVHQIAAAREALTPLLTDADPDVRLQSLRALGRIDLAYTQGLEVLAALREDPDAKVARAADKLATQKRSSG